jgi:chemotaxis methyl-accepting protein methylase
VVAAAAAAAAAALVLAVVTSSNDAASVNGTDSNSTVLKATATAIYSERYNRSVTNQSTYLKT